MNNEEKTCNCACQGTGPLVTNVVSNLISSMAPPEASSHFRAARVEFLKGLRSLLDSRIEELSKTPRREQTGTAVPVE